MKAKNHIEPDYSEYFKSLSKHLNTKGSSPENNAKGETESKNETIEDYDNLPSLLKESLDPIPIKERELMTLVFLVAIGSILRNVRGKFRDSWLYPNLYLLVIAPAASGKSRIKYGRDIVKEINRTLINESEKAKSQYKLKQSEYAKGNISLAELGDEPFFPLLLIGDNITSAMFIRQLLHNDGYGFMFGTELDSLNDSSSAHKAHVNDVLRKASEGEPYSYFRKTDNDRTNIECCRLSLCISGTPKQFTDFIRSFENGLFSRIITYSFKSERKWLSSSSSEYAFDYEEHYNKLSQRLLSYFEILRTRTKEIKFYLKQNQLEKLDEVFSSRLDSSYSTNGDFIQANVKRQAAMLTKIAMVLSVLRSFENDTIQDEIKCDDIDFDTALKLSSIIFDHSVRGLNLLNGEFVEQNLKGKEKRDYFYALPNEFDYKQSQDLAAKKGMSLNTAQKWIRSFETKGLIIRIKKGHYKKVAQ